MANEDTNTQAKHRIIESYFDDLEARIEFCVELRESGHDHEALLLCCSYIDGLANQMYWTDDRSNYNFVRLIKEYGECKVLTQVHPQMLLDYLSGRRGKRVQAILRKTRTLLENAKGRLYSEEGIGQMTAPHHTAHEREWFSRNVWRGTLAAFTYASIRSSFIHGLGGPQGISFDETTFQGEPVPTIGFDMLYECLLRIEQSARSKSLETDKWFGHDYHMKEDQED